jgi:N4-gp56 family major capsid protein
MQYTDELDMENYDPIVSEVAGILGEQAGLSADTIIRTALTDGATVDYSGDAASRGALDAPQHNITFADFIKQVAALEAANSLPVDGEDFAVILTPHSWATLMQDATFVNMFVQEAPNSALRNGYVGRILRCKVYVSGNAREYADAGVGSTTDVYSALFIAQESYGLVGMGNITPDVVDGGPETERNMTGKPVKPVEIIAKPLGSAGADDPLNQRGTIGWKMALDVEILNSAWIRNLEHTTVFSDD